MREATARCDEELKHVIEASRVALARHNERQELLQIVTDDFALQERFAGAKAVQVTTQGVNFTVVSKVAERVGERPSRERVGRIALVHESQGAFKIEVVQVLIETFDLACKQQALVNDALAAAAANIHTLAGLFDQATHHIKLDIEFFVGLELGAVKEHLANVRQGFASRMADCRSIHRHFTEVDHSHTFGFRNTLDFCIKRIGCKSIFNKIHGHTVTRRQFRIKLAEELMGHRKQKTRTITSFRVSTCCTAVHKSFQNSDTLQHNLVRGNIINIGNKTDTAGVVFVGRIVKCLSVHK